MAQGPAALPKATAQEGFVARLELFAVYHQSQEKLWLDIKIEQHFLVT